MRDEAVPSASAPDVRAMIKDSADEKDPENGPWLPADGAAFPASAELGTASAMTRVTGSDQSSGSLPVMHPIYALESGVINVRDSDSVAANI